MTSNPIACSLDAEQLAERRRWASRLADDALIDARPTRDGVAAQFRPDALDDLRRLVAAESACCPFMSFDIEEGADSVLLRVGAPPEARQLVYELFGSDTRPT